MDNNQIVALLRIAKSQKNKAEENRKAVNNEIAGLKLSMDEAIDNDGDLKIIRDFKHERTTKESYRKQLNATAHKLEGDMDNILFGKGDYNKTQLTFFDEAGNAVPRDDIEEITDETEEEEETEEETEEKEDKEFFGEPVPEKKAETA